MWGGGAILLSLIFEVFVLPQKLFNMSALGHQSQILLSTLGVNFDLPILDF